MFLTTASVCLLMNSVMFWAFFQIWAIGSIWTGEELIVILRKVRVKVKVSALWWRYAVCRLVSIQ